MKTHLRDGYETLPNRPACRYDSVPDEFLTDDPSLVTCLNCERTIEERLQTPAERARKTARRKAKQSAVQRAKVELADLHHVEFQQLVRKHYRDEFPRWLNWETKIEEHLAEAGLR